MESHCKQGFLHPPRLVTPAPLYSHFTTALNLPQAYLVLHRPFAAPAKATGFEYHRAGCHVAQVLEEVLI